MSGMFNSLLIFFFFHKRINETLSLHRMGSNRYFKLLVRMDNYVLENDSNSWTCASQRGSTRLKSWCDLI